MSRLKKLGSKHWKIIVEAGYDQNGKRKRKVKRVHVSIDEARKIKRKMEAKYAKKKPLKNNIKLDKHLLEWLDIHQRNLKPNTIESYKNQINAYIIPHMGQKPLKSLTPKMIDEFYGHLLKHGKKRDSGGLSKRSVRYIHIILQKALDKAVDWNRLDNNPAKKTSPPTTSPRNKTIKPKELIDIINNTKDPFYKNLFEFALRTGLRRGEILGLMWPAINIEKNIILVVNNLQKYPDKGFVIEKLKNDREYTIPIGQKVKNILLEIQKQQEEDKQLLKRAYKDDKLVFARKDGAPLSPQMVYKYFKKTSSNVGYDYTFHDLRHGFGAIQIMSGTHTKTLQKLLNHKTERITADIYSHISGTQKHEAAKKVDDFF